MDSRIRASRRQEIRGAKLHGGTRNSGSGNGPWRKADVRTPDELWEFKRTDKEQFTLKLRDLLTAEKHALSEGRSMRFGIEINGRHWVVLSEEDYLELRGNT